MKNNQLKSEKGLTLIEVLASLSIFAILIVLSSTLIIQLVSSEGKTSDSISLQQHTNVLVAEIRSQFYDDTNSSICFKESQKMINKNKTVFKNGDNIIPINSGCIDDIDSSEELSIQLTTNTNTGESFTVETTLTTKEDYVLTLEAKEENPDDFDGEENISGCTFTESIKFINYIKTKNGNPGCSYYQFQQSVAFLDGVRFQNHSTVQIKGNLYVKNELKIQPNTKVIVYGNFYMEGNLDVKGELCIKGEFPNKKNYKSNNYETSGCS